jgi:hypothetical protein
MRPANRDAWTIREALLGNIGLEMLPFELQRQIKAIARRLERQQFRFQKRETNAQRYASVGLNGKRAVERRLRQIAAGQLRVENGLVA